MKGKTLTQELIELQSSLKESMTELDSAAATREALAAPYMRADAKAKIARQIINAAQAVIRIQRLKSDISAATAGTKA